MNFQDFSMVRILGEGVSGRCYLAIHKHTGESCVIKQISTEGMGQDQINKAMNQVSILQLMKHPNITQFIGSFSTHDALHIAMSYAEGGDLSTKVRETKTSFSQSQILEWFTQICLALKHVHENKIIHRDIKTQNIFITTDGKIKLGDFGIAASLKITLQKIKSVVGTPYCISPQICENQPYSYKTDIWSLGVVLYELCALKPPFDAESLAGLVIKICRGHFRPIPLHYSEGIRKLIGSMLQINSEKRPTILQILQNSLIQISLEKIKLKQLGNVDSELVSPRMVQHGGKYVRQITRQKIPYAFQLNNLNDKIECSPKINHYLSGSPIKSPECKKFLGCKQHRVRDKIKTAQKSHKTKNKHGKSQSCLTPKIKKNNEDKRVKKNYSLWQKINPRDQVNNAKDLWKDKKKNKRQFTQGQLDKIQEKCEQKESFLNLDDITQMKNAISLRKDDMKYGRQDFIDETPIRTLEGLIIEQIGQQKFIHYSQLVQSSMGFCNQLGQAKYLFALWYGIKIDK